MRACYYYILLPSRISICIPGWSKYFFYYEKDFLFAHQRKPCCQLDPQLNGYYKNSLYSFLWLKNPATASNKIEWGVYGAVNIADYPGILEILEWCFGKKICLE